MVYGLDPNVLNNIKTIDDYNRLNEEHQLKRQLLMQNAQQQQLQTAVAMQTLAGGGITPYQRATMAQGDRRAEAAEVNAEANRQNQRDLVTMRYDMEKDKLQEKKDLKMRNDQNLLAGALQANQAQIDKIDSLFDEKGSLKPNYAAPYGTVMGYQPPNVFQSTKDASTVLDNINANSFIQALGNMKTQSATGASGLGALSEREGDKVQSASNAAANREQSPESAARNWLSYRESLTAANKRLLSGFQNIYGNQGQSVAESLPGSGGAGPIGDNVPQGAQLIGTSGGKPVYRLPDGRGWTP